MTSDSNVVIRPVGPDDLDASQEVKAAAFSPVFARLRAASGHGISTAALASAEKDQAALLARLCRGDDGATVLAIMRERGIRVVEVATGADAAHAPARKAHEKAGFVVKLETLVMHMELG